MFVSMTMMMTMTEF